MKNILVALNLDEGDQELLKHGISLAEKYDSKMWIIHVAAPDPDFVGYGVGPQYVREMRAEELRDEHRKLQEWMENAKDSGIEAEALQVQGSTIEMLETEIEKLKIDLVIIGRHRHGFLYETFVGNTSSQLMKRVSVPILVMPAMRA